MYVIKFQKFVYFKFIVFTCYSEVAIFCRKYSLPLTGYSRPDGCKEIYTVTADSPAGKLVFYPCP
jgi:hypothetical protein